MNLSFDLIRRIHKVTSLLTWNLYVYDVRLTICLRRTFDSNLFLFISIKVFTFWYKWMKANDVANNNCISRSCRNSICSTASKWIYTKMNWFEVRMKSSIMFHVQFIKNKIIWLELTYEMYTTCVGSQNITQMRFERMQYSFYAIQTYIHGSKCHFDGSMLIWTWFSNRFIKFSLEIVVFCAMLNSPYFIHFHFLCHLDCWSEAAKVKLLFM